MVLRRVSVVVGSAVAAAVGGLALAAAASAHVTVSAPGATQGGIDQIITFRVPNESATAATTELQVKFPTTTPIASVLPEPHPGWTVATTTVKLAKPIVTDDGDITEAVSTVTWKADAKATGIPVGQFDEFVVIAGLLPEAPSLTFPAIQTYSDGKVVSWNQVAAPGSTSEPDDPAPVLTLGKASTDTATAATPTASGKSSDTGAIVVAVIALVLAAASVGYTTVRTAKRG
jgi:uncharacterized protein YcnI